MKQVFMILLVFSYKIIEAQNTFPSTGSVGIGTLTPAYTLDVAGTLRGWATYNNYTTDGLFSANAQPSGINTPNGAMRIRFGYLDQGSGQYWGRVGFLGNTNWALGTAYGGHSFSIGRNYYGEDFLIDNEGKVGIGISTPSYKLDVAGTIRGWANYSTYTPDGLFSANALPSGINTPNGAMRIRFGYFDQGSGQYWGRVGFLGNTNWALGTASGGHSFSIGRNYGGEDFLIDNEGRVGIGTSTPSSSLHVYGTRAVAKIEASLSGDHASLELKAAGNNGGGAPSVYFNRGENMYGALFVERGSDGGNQPIFTGSNTTDFVLGSTAAVPLRFGINREIKMSLDVSGKLGIGTVNPGSTLHVRRDSYGEQFRISAFGDGINGTGLSIGIMGVIPAAYGTQTSYYTAINNGYAADDNSLLIVNDKGYNNGEKFADFAIGNGKGNPIMFADGSEAKIGIGTTTPSEKLSVNGNVRAKKVIVSQTGWPDYVFDPAYKLKSLSEVSAFIQQHKYLPDLPSAKEVEEKGISLGDNQALLLKKIEELTLYLIKLNTENEQSKQEIKLLKQQLDRFLSSKK